MISRLVIMDACCANGNNWLEDRIQSSTRGVAPIGGWKELSFR